MFEKPQREEGLEEAITLLLSEMKGFTADSDEYSRMIGHLNLLYKIKDQEKPDRISKDTIAVIAGNLAGIVMILGFERANVITSKALSFVMKAR